MTTPHANQVVIEADALTLGWGFDNGGPAYGIHHAGTWHHAEKVDPAPCYAHEASAVRAELAHLQAVAPLPWPIGIFLLKHELLGRTNAFYRHDRVYDANDSTVSWPVGLIVMSGKRIPIHPAMTRYLVAHEYGHSIEQLLTVVRGFRSSQQLLEDYRGRVRPEASSSYGCGQWHQNIGELFANDFRILVANREIDFWPHAGFDHPHCHLPALEFWAEAVKDLRRFAEGLVFDARVLAVAR